jgi:hypothetical protein
VNVWITSLAGLRGVAQQSRYPAGLRDTGLVEIVNACGSLAWQALGAQSGRDHVGLRGGSLGERGPGGAEEWAQGSEIPLFWGLWDRA